MKKTGRRLFMTGCILGLLLLSSCSESYNKKERAEGEKTRLTALLEKEEKDPCVEEGIPQVELEELLKVIQKLEVLMSIEQDEKVRQAAFKKYEEYLKAAITGGYEEEAKEPHLYIEEKTNQADGKAIETYNAVITKNPDTKTAVILVEYIKILEESHKEIDDRVINFYRSLDKIIQDSFQK